MEADLLRFYGLDLWAELTGPRLRWGRLRVLLGHLPRDAATVRAQAGEQALWGPAEQLLALAVDALHVANWQRSDPKKAGNTPPKRIPTPFTPKRGADRGELLARLAGRNSDGD